MYSTCLHCHRPLGRNDAIEHFPVGRRLAFDAAKGRLWVVCAACSRWNLTPIEERWEAVEESEKLFRGQPLRAQTDNIGLVRVGDGTELVRIGPALRPEFAAWRYGGMFRRRFRRRAALTAGVGASAAAGTAALYLAGLPNLALFVAAPLAIVSTVRLATSVLELRGNVPTHVPRVIGNDGKPLTVLRTHFDHVKLTARAGESLRLWLPHASARRSSGRRHREDRRGSSAPRGKLRGVRRGVRTGPRGGTLREVLEAQVDIQRRSGRALNGLPPSNPGALHRLPAVHRLALEMLLHEQSEQHALDQDLAALERAWHEAEEIAGIADGLLVSERTTRVIDAARRRPS